MQLRIKELWTIKIHLLLVLASLDFIMKLEINQYVLVVFTD